MREIERLLCVSRSSVSRWVHDIELTPQQHEALRLRNGRHPAQRRANLVWSGLRRAERERFQEEGRAVARRGDAVHAAGCMLYWAEGRKGRNTVALSNADPEVLRFFVAFLVAYFAVPREKFRVWCNLFADHADRQREIEQFWLDLFNLPRTCLTKSIVNVHSKYSLRKRTNVLPYGTCRITVHDTAIVQHISVPFRSTPVSSVLSGSADHSPGAAGLSYESFSDACFLCSNVLSPLPRKSADHARRPAERARAELYRVELVSRRARRARS
jgi:hypothetical protein